MIKSVSAVAVELLSLDIDDGGLQKLTVTRIAGDLEARILQ